MDAQKVRKIKGKDGIILSSSDMTWDVEEIYTPMYECLLKVVERIRILDLDIPIYVIARMEVHDTFSRKRHIPLRKDIYDFLHATNDYRKFFWDIEKEAKKVFDNEMNKQHSFSPTTKEYKSLKIALGEELLNTDGKVWAMSYNTHLATINQTSVKDGKAVPHRDGTTMYMVIKKRVMPSLDELTRLRGEADVSAMRMLKIAAYLKNHPWSVLAYNRSVNTALKAEDETFFEEGPPKMVAVNKGWDEPAAPPPTSVPVEITTEPSKEPPKKPKEPPKKAAKPPAPKGKKKAGKDKPRTKAASKASSKKADKPKGKKG